MKYIAVAVATLIGASVLMAESGAGLATPQGRFADALDASKAPAVSVKELPEYKSVPLTVEFWCKINRADEYNVMVSNQPKESSAHWEIYAAPGGRLGAHLPGFTPEDIPTQAKLADGKWHHVAMVLDKSAVSLFLDGKQEAKVGITEKASGVAVPGPLYVGQATSSRRSVPCDGSIDELRISRGARTITGIPDAPFVPDENTVGLWHFDHPAGEAATPGATEFSDSSIHANSLRQTPVVSLSVTDRASYKAGPSPLESPARPIALKEGSLSLPEVPPSYSLDGDWQLAVEGTPEERLKGAWADEIKAPVPGSVHTALFQAGLIPHPYEGKNQEIAKEWSYKTYYYKKKFPRPPKGQDETLVFEGICNRCEVWLNGRKLGDHEGMFDPVEYPVKDLLQDDNTVMVKLDPAIEWRKTVVFNNSYGWHYSKFPPLGIWRSVSVRGEPDPRMQSPFVATINAPKGVVDLMTSFVGVGDARGGKLEGVIAPDNFEGKTYHFEHDIATGTKDIHLRFEIPDPQLWWPVDMGRPNLYRLHLAFLPNGGGRADVKDIRFGIRTVEMAPVNGKPRPDLVDWTFVINGRPMFVKGTGWCTMDAMMDFSRARYERFLDLARDQHIQMLRAWGPGLVETDDFYDLCDRNGIMVMQEWPTSWNSHLTQPFDMLEKTVRTGILRLRNHPSLVIYGAGNESKDPYGPAIDMMGRLSIELDGTRDFHRGEPFAGSSHNYKVYWHGEHIDYAFSMSAIFYGEFGIPSYPCLESARRFLPKEEQNLWPPPDEGSLGYHTPQFNAVSNLGNVSPKRDMDRLMALARYFTAGETMEKFITGSQLAQAVGVRHPLERMRTRWPNSTGALYYKMNDNCPAASWATVDWYGAPKISHYLIQDSFSPILAVVLFDKASSYGEALSAPVFLLDDANDLEDGDWEVLVRVYGSDLQLIKESRFTGRGSIDRVKPLGAFTLDATQTKTTPLLVVTDVKQRGVSLQRNYYFTNFERAQGCLFTLPKSSVSMQLGKGEVTVKNTGNLPAVGVNISRPGHLDTLTVEDNYFWLDAGETRTLKVSDTKGLVIDGWNMEKTN